MPHPLTDLSDFERDMLTQLAGMDGAAGIEVIRALEAHHGRIDSTHGYQALDKLIAENYIDKQAADGRTNAYSLTGAGRDALVTDVEWRIQMLEG